MNESEARNLETDARTFSRRALLGALGVGAASAAVGVDLFGIPSGAWASVPFPLANPWTGYIPGDTFEMHELRGSPNPGVDFEMDVGTALQAPHAGALTSWESGTYSYAQIVHPTGWRTQLVHPRPSQFTTNRTVVIDEIVAYSGGAVGTPGAGNSTGPHNHWSLRSPAGDNIDPLTVINTGAGAVPNPYQEVYDVTDLIFYVQSGTATTASSAVHAGGAGIAPNQMWYQECPGAPLFKLTNDYTTAGVEYQAFYGARFSNANATRYPVTAAQLKGLIELRGLALVPKANLATAT